MKVVLKRDVKGVGRLHEEVEAKDGYALNFLIPQGFAIPATPAALVEAKKRREQVVARHELDTKLAVETIAHVAEAPLTIMVKANEKGHLYEAVDVEKIAEATKLPAEAIKLEKPIKELGTYQIPVAYGDAFGEFSLTVVAE